MKKIRLGVLGVSGHLMTRIMLPLMQTDKVELVALASRNHNKAEGAAKEWKVPKAYGSYEALLEDEEIEVVYIPLPNHMHLEWMKKSIDAGKHILCEKPLTMNADETKEIMGYAKSKNVKVMEAFMYRFHPKWQMVRELMKVKGIGEVHSIHTIFTYNNNDPKNIRNIKAYGGGALMDIGCYAISSARWIMNKEPKKVMGMIHHSDVFETDVLTSGILDFGMARALFTVGTGTYPSQEVKVYGSSGRLEVKIPFNDLYDVPGKIIVTNALGERTIESEPTNQYKELLEVFAESIIEDKEVPLSLEDSYMNMRIIDQLSASGQSGQWMDIYK